MDTHKKCAAAPGVGLARRCGAKASDVNNHNTDRILNKARHLKAFVQKQRSRERRVDSRTQWRLSYISLQEELDDCVSQFICAVKDIGEDGDDLTDLAAELENTLQNAQDERESVRNRALALREHLRSDLHEAKTFFLQMKEATAVLLLSLHREEKKLEKELKSYRLSFAPVVGSISCDVAFDGGEIGKDVAMTVLDKSRLELQELSRLFDIRHDTWQQKVKRNSTDCRKNLLSNDQCRLFGHLKQKHRLQCPNRKELLDRIRSVMPQMTPQSIESYSSWQTERAMLKSEGRVLRVEFQEKYDRIVNGACTTLKEELCRLEKQSEDVEIITNQRITGCLARGALEKARDERAIRRREAERRHMICERERYLKRQAQDRLRQSRHMQNKQKIAEHKEALNFRKMEVEEAETEQQAKLAMKRELQRRRNAHRVSFRRQKYGLALQCRKERLLQAQKRQMLPRKRQERLLGTLSWKAERNADRAMADTATSHQRKSCESKKASPFHPIHGFVAETLERDLRFRVHEALIQCGLHKSPYAKHALLFYSSKK